MLQTAALCAHFAFLRIKNPRLNTPLNLHLQCAQCTTQCSAAQHRSAVATAVPAACCEAATRRVATTLKTAATAAYDALELTPAASMTAVATSATVAGMKVDEQAGHQHREHGSAKFLRCAPTKMLYSSEMEPHSADWCSV